MLKEITILCVSGNSDLKALAQGSSTFLKLELFIRVSDLCPRESHMTLQRIQVDLWSQIKKEQDTFSLCYLT